MSASFEDKVVVISGASSGLGLATARRFCAAGARVVGLDVRAPAEPPGESFRHIEINVIGYEQVGACVREILYSEKSIDCLVNNAGISRDATVWKMTEDHWNAVIDVNLKGPFNLIHHVAPHFRKAERGKIVNVSSINGLRGKFGLSNYAASKAGLIGMTKTVARELGRYGVNVNAVAPGLLLTPLTRELTPAQIDEALEETVLERLTTAEDVAEVILFLCSDAARQITGEVIRVDGGQYI